MRQERRTGYAGGMTRARRMLGMTSKFLERFQGTAGRATTTPTVDRDDLAGTAGAASSGSGAVPHFPEELPLPPQGAPRVYGPVHEQQSSGSEGQRRRAKDLTPHTADMFSYLNCEDCPDWDPTDDLTCEETDLPPEARRVPEKLKRMVRNAHRNLGHPGNFALVRLMKTAKCPDDVICYARCMKCPTCLRRQAPDRIPRVAMPYRPTRFNTSVGLDIKWVKDSAGKKMMCLNILDLATCFSVFVPIIDKKPTTIASVFKWAWINWAGAPEKIVADRGSEFFGEFKEMTTLLGSRCRIVPTEAQWQNGMVERHGAVLGDIVEATCMETNGSGFEELRDICLHAAMAKNRRPGRTGYSPRSLVFGVDERLVLSGLNHYLEEPDDAAMANASLSETVKRSIAFRKSAMKQIVELDHSTKWAEAIKFPSRSVDVQFFLPGHQIAFWRRGNSKKGKARSGREPDRWRLGTVIGHEYDGKNQLDSYWTSSDGNCFLVPAQHMRHATMEEVLSTEGVMRSATKTLESLQRDPTNFKWYDMRRPLRPDEVEPPGVLYERTDQPEVPGPQTPPECQDDYVDPSRAPDLRQPRTPPHPEDLARAVRRRLMPDESRVAPPQDRVSDHSHSTRAPEARDDANDEVDSLSGGDDTPPIQGPEIPGYGNIGDLLSGLPAEEDVLEAVGHTAFYVRHLNHVLVADHKTQEVFLLKWKTFKKNQRKGRELDPRAFDSTEKKAFSISDAKEWQSFLDTGAVVVIPPGPASKIPNERIFKRAARYVRTNKDKSGIATNLQSKSRIVVPGDVDPDGDDAVEDGGFRTDAPTAPQLAFHLLMSYAVRFKWRLRTFDVKTAFLSGKEHNREIYMRPPPDGLPGVAPGSLLKIVKGAYGLREAPRLWYLKAREVILSCGWEELRTARACFVLRDKTKETSPLCGFMVLHVDDACYGGEGKFYKDAIDNVLKQFKIGTENEKEFDFLGRHVKQLDDFSIEIDQHQYVSGLERVHIPKERRMKPKAKLTADELTTFRSIVGQLAWPARETMPQLSYAVSDLQQKTADATVHDLCHANNVLSLAKKWAAQDKQKLRFRAFSGDVCVSLVMPKDKDKSKKWKKAEDRRIRLGIGAIHDASFMQQKNEGSQMGYAIMLAPISLYDGPCVTHLLDWNSSKIHRKVRSTLAAEAAGASKAYDRAVWTRAVIYEIEKGRDGKHWSETIKHVPFALGTDCKSLYDVASKIGSVPDERRVALDLLDVKEGIEEGGDIIRWVPTDHMLADCFTKSMPPDLMMKYLTDGVYSLKYDTEIKNTKRECAKDRKQVRADTAQKKSGISGSDKKKLQTPTRTPTLPPTKPSTTWKPPPPPPGSKRLWSKTQWTPNTKPPYDLSARLQARLAANGPGL
jgi:hypothetical protein